jgi:hypothetical protein
MNTAREARKVPHGSDGAVATALEGARAMPATGSPVLVAFRNERGELYRYAVLEGSAQVRYLRQRLAQMHLLADPEDSAGVLTVLGPVDGGLLRALALSWR